MPGFWLITALVCFIHFLEAQGLTFYCIKLSVKGRPYLLQISILDRYPGAKAASRAPIKLFSVLLDLLIVFCIFGSVAKKYAYIILSKRGRKCELVYSSQVWKG